METLALRLLCLFSSQAAGYVGYAFHFSDIFTMLDCAFFIPLAILYVEL